MKPCPFCGASGDRVFALWDHFDAGHIGHVHCAKCGADGPSVYSEEGPDEVGRMAREKWDSRVDAPKP